MHIYYNKTTRYMHIVRTFAYCIFIVALNILDLYTKLKQIAIWRILTMPLSLFDVELSQLTPPPATKAKLCACLCRGAALRQDWARPQL